MVILPWTQPKTLLRPLIKWLSIVTTTWFWTDSSTRGRGEASKLRSTSKDQQITFLLRGQIYWPFLSYFVLIWFLWGYIMCQYWMHHDREHGIKFKYNILTYRYRSGNGIFRWLLISYTDSQKPCIGKPPIHKQAILLWQYGFLKFKKS